MDFTLASYRSVFSEGPLKRRARSSLANNACRARIFGVCTGLHNFRLADNGATLTVRNVHSRSTRGKDALSSKTTANGVFSSFRCLTDGKVVGDC